MTRPDQLAIVFSICMLTCSCLIPGVCFRLTAKAGASPHWVSRLLIPETRAKATPKKATTSGVRAWSALPVTIHQNHEPAWQGVTLSLCCQCTFPSIKLWICLRQLLALPLWSYT